MTVNDVFMQIGRAPTQVREFYLWFRPVASGGGSMARWRLSPGSLDRMIADAKQRTERPYVFNFVDVHGLEVQIGVDHAGEECFRTLTDYAEKVAGR